MHTKQGSVSSINIMKAKEPIASNYTQSNPIIPHLRNYIMEKLEDERDLNVLEKIYSIISPEDELSYEEKFAIAKEQTEQYCPIELARDLEAEGYMIDKPYPYEDEISDIDTIIKEDEEDVNAPEEWIRKMFPELYV